MNRVFAWPVGSEGERMSLSVVVVYSLMAAVGGAMTGSVVGITGTAATTAMPDLFPAAAVALAAVAATLQLTGSMAFLPQRHAQVPDRWMVWNPYGYAGAFGLSLGLGFLTWVREPIAYVVVALTSAHASLTLGLVVGLAYGVTRGVVPLLARSGSVKSLAALENALVNGRARIAFRFALAGLAFALVFYAAP